MAQALLMPLKFGLSLDETGMALGLSKRWALRLRKRFGRIQCGQEQPKSKRGLRNRACMTLNEEATLLAPYIEQARQRGCGYCAPTESHARKSLRLIHGAIYSVCNVASPWLAPEALAPTHTSHGDPGITLRVCGGLTCRRRLIR